MHDVTVVCQSCGKQFTYQTMFISTAGVAVCPCCACATEQHAARQTRVSSRHEGARP